LSLPEKNYLLSADTAIKTTINHKIGVVRRRRGRRGAYNTRTAWAKMTKVMRRCL
jgi:hypothetical protein